MDLRIRAPIGAGCSRSGRGGSGWRSVHATSASDNAPTPANTTSVPIPTASVPTIGPSKRPEDRHPEHRAEHLRCGARAV